MDIRDVLPVIDVPTIVAHREGDLLVPKENSRYIAGRIPGAVYAELSGQDHLWWFGDQRALVDVVERFLAGLPERRDPERILATVVVAHTADSPGPGGVAVDVAAEISSLAGAGEILVSSTVEDLVAGSGMTFQDRGIRRLAAAPGERRLLAFARA